MKRTERKPCLLSSSSWAIAVVVSPLQLCRIVKLKFLLKRQLIKLSPQGKLIIYFFLTDTEVLDIEEPCYTPNINTKTK